MIPARRSEILHELAENCLQVSAEGTEFVLHGGGTSQYFLDVPSLFRQPRFTYGLLGQLANLLDKLDDSTPWSLLSIDTGGTYCAMLLQQYLFYLYDVSIPLYRVEKAKKRPYVGGDIVLIDDVLTSGSSVLPVIEEIQKAEVRPFQALPHIIQFITVVNRQEGGGEQRILEKNISFSSLFTLNEILQKRRRFS